MKKTILLVTILLFAAGCSKKANKETTQKYEAALETVNRFPIQAADSAFADLTNRSDSADWRAYQRGMVQEYRLQYLEAADEYWKILDKSEEFAPAYLGLARVMSRLQYPYLAIDMAREYARYSPSAKNGDFVLARYLMAAGELKEARDVISDARQAGLDTAVADWMEARALYENQELDRAAEFVTRALASKNRTADFYTEAAFFYEASGKYDSANVMSQAAVAASDGNVASLDERFFLNLKMHYFYDARQTIKLISAKDTNTVLHNTLLQHYYTESGNYPAAFMAFTAGRTAGGETLNSLLLEFGIRRRVGDHFTANQAMQTLDINKDRVGHSPRFREFVEYMQYRMNLDIRRYPEALNALDSLEGAWLKGDQYDLQRAVVRFATEVPEAAKELDKLRDKHDNDPAWLMRMGDELAQPTLYKSAEAEKYYAYSLERSSGYLPAFEHLIDMLLSLREYDKALKAFESYPYFSAASPVLAVKQAACMARNGDAGAAVELFDNNVAEISGDLFAIDDFCQGLHFKYSNRELLGALDKLTSMDKNNPDILAMSAQWYSDIGEYKKAESAADDALDIQPDMLDASVQKARAEFLKGDKNKGLALFASLIKTDPFDTELNLYYSHALASEKKDIRLAGNYARAAIASVRDIKRAMSNLWYVYGQDGRWDLATGEARKLTTSYPNDPRSFFMLGKALVMSDKAEKKTEAKGALRKAIELGLQGPDKTEAEGMLAKL